MDIRKLIDPKCKDCRYFRKLKHHFQQGQGFEMSGCCIALMDGDEDNGDAYAFVIETSEENDGCEMFSYDLKQLKEMQR